MPSTPAQKRFSREGFQQLHPTTSNTTMNPNDATIDIPLTTVNSRGQTGARKADATLSPSGYFPPTGLQDNSNNEKSGLFHHKSQHLAAGRRRKRGEENGSAARKQETEEGTITQMGKIYNAILNFSVITRYFLYVLPLGLLIAVPIVVGATVAQDAELGGVRIVWIFTWIEIVWLSLWVAKLIAQLLPGVFQFFCGIVSSGTRKYALVLKALEIPLSLVGWTLTSLCTFIPLMTKNPTQRALKAHNPHATDTTDWEAIGRSILFAGFIASLIFLAEKFLIQLISIGYHRKQFDNKIKDSKHNIYLLSLLYDASRALFPAYCPEFAAEDYVINDSIELGMSKGGSGHARSGSVTPMRLIQNIGRVGDKVTAAFGNVAQEITGKQVFNPNSAHSIVVEALEKNKSSEALARRIWMSFVVEGRDNLYQEDLIEVLGEGRLVEAEECFAALDRDNNGDISLDEMVLTVCEFGRERHSIANSMHDVDQAINVLDTLLCAVAFIIIIFIFVAFLNKSFTTTLATAGTALLSLSFVFAATAQEVLGSCIFLFVKHPYDVGDRVDIGDNQLTVERISLLFTIFRKIKDHKTTQVPNIVLNSNWIENVTRSKAMREQVFLYVNFDTTLEDIQLLKDEMQTFVLDKENSRDFQPDIDVEVTGMAEMNKLELKVEIRHKSNWANETVRAARRSKFMCALVLAIRKIPLYGPGGGDAALGDLSKPSYSVAISEEMAQHNREEFTTNKDKKRLVPAKSPSPPPASEKPTGIGKSTAVDYLGRSNGASTTRPSVATAPETTVVDTLNARPPAFDPARDDSPTSSDGRRSNDLEEVRGLLRKESLTGRRRAGPYAATAPSIPTIAEPTRRPVQSPTRAVDYHDYAPPPSFAAPPAINTGAGAQIRAQNPVERTQSPYYSNNPYSGGPTNQSQSPTSNIMSPPPLQVQNRRPVNSPTTAGPGQAGNLYSQQQQQQQR